MDSLFALEELLDENGNGYYSKWINRLSPPARARVRVAVDKLALGIFGNCAPVGEGVSELKIDFGPGYRVYFVKTGKKVLLLLGGGQKRRQQQDIKMALSRYEDFKKRRKENK